MYNVHSFKPLALKSCNRRKASGSCPAWEHKGGVPDVTMVGVLVVSFWGVVMMDTGGVVSEGQSGVAPSGSRGVGGTCLITGSGVVVAKRISSRMLWRGAGLCTCRNFRRNFRLRSVTRLEPGLENVFIFHIR